MLSREKGSSEQELDEQPKKRKWKQLKSSAHENTKRKRKQLRCVYYIRTLYTISGTIIG